MAQDQADFVVFEITSAAQNNTHTHKHTHSYIHSHTQFVFKILQVLYDPVNNYTTNVHVF
jgi:hypothetical protein